MKAIKFVILGFGLLGVISFFLPYAKIGGESISAMDAMKGADALGKAADAATDSVVDSDALNEDQKSEAKKNLSEVGEVLDTIKGIIIIMFAPAFLMALIGGIGAARGKLERLGGAGVMILGFIGLAINGIFLAAWGSAEVKEAGGDAAIAQYLLTMTCAAGFVLGLLTQIKPDRGGKFG